MAVAIMSGLTRLTILVYAPPRSRKATFYFVLTLWCLQKSKFIYIFFGFVCIVEAERAVGMREGEQFITVTFRVSVTVSATINVFINSARTLRIAL